MDGLSYGAWLLLKCANWKERLEIISEGISILREYIDQDMLDISSENMLLVEYVDNLINSDKIEFNIDQLNLFLIEHGPLEEYTCLDYYDDVVALGNFLDKYHKKVVREKEKDFNKAMYNHLYGLDYFLADINNDGELLRQLLGWAIEKYSLDTIDKRLEVEV